MRQSNARIKQVFCIFGYGVPYNILRDKTYAKYLLFVATYIYKEELKKKILPVLILSGGRTDCFKPYHRTEAGEMKRYFDKKKSTHFSKWEFIVEKSSLSTLENFLHCSKIIHKQRLPKKSVVIFCEKSRLQRVRVLARAILKGYTGITIVPVSFGKIALTEKAFIRKKESLELHHALDAIKSKKRLVQHHELFKKKFAYLRKAGSKNTKRALREWWEDMRQFSFT